MGTLHIGKNLNFVGWVEARNPTRDMLLALELLGNKRQANQRIEVRASHIRKNLNFVGWVEARNPTRDMLLALELLGNKRQANQRDVMHCSVPIEVVCRVGIAHLFS